MTLIFLIIISIDLTYMAMLLLRILNKLEEKKPEEKDPEVKESVTIKSKKTVIYAPGADSMSEFSGKKDDWYGDKNE